VMSRPRLGEPGGVVLVLLLLLCEDMSRDSGKVGCRLIDVYQM